MEKSRVLVVADTYYPKVDGVLMFISEFLQRAKHDFSLSLLVPQFSRETIKNVNIIFLDLSHRFHAFTYPTIKFSRDNLRKIKAAVQDHDVIFIQELGPAGFFALRYALRYQKKVVLYVHNTPWDFLTKHYQFNAIIAKVVERFFVHYYNQADLLLVPYKDLRRRLQVWGVRSPMEIARLGVDINRFSPTLDRAKAKLRVGLPLQKIIGYVGRVSREKNTLTLLDAFSKLNRDDTFLLIVGDGQKEIVEELQRHPRCKVTGFVYNVEDYLKAMDVFVMPSLTETTSLATLEAMASGLPVITTRVGFMQHYITKDYNGLFFPKNNPSSLAVQLNKVLNDRNLQQKLGQNARKTVAYSFSWERSINKIKKFLG